MKKKTANNSYFNSIMSTRQTQCTLLATLYQLQVSATATKLTSV